MLECVWEIEREGWGTWEDQGEIGDKGGKYEDDGYFKLIAWIRCADPDVENSKTTIPINPKPTNNPPFDRSLTKH